SPTAVAILPEVPVSSALRLTKDLGDQSGDLRRVWHAVAQRGPATHPEPYRGRPRAVDLCRRGLSSLGRGLLPREPDPTVPHPPRARGPELGEAADPARYRRRRVPLRRPLLRRDHPGGALSGNARGPGRARRPAVGGRLQRRPGARRVLALHAPRRVRPD